MDFVVHYIIPGFGQYIGSKEGDLQEIFRIFLLVWVAEEPRAESTKTGTPWRVIPRPSLPKILSGILPNPR
jgi:hypothetical protein